MLQLFRGITLLLVKTITGEEEVAEFLFQEQNQIRFYLRMAKFTTDLMGQVQEG